MNKNKYRNFDTEEEDIKRAIESLNKLIEARTLKDSQLQKEKESEEHDN